MDLEDFCLVWNFDFPDFYSIMVTAVFNIVLQNHTAVSFMWMNPFTKLCK